MVGLAARIGYKKHYLQKECSGRQGRGGRSGLDTWTPAREREREGGGGGGGGSGEKVLFTSEALAWVLSELWGGGVWRVWRSKRMELHQGHVLCHPAGRPLGIFGHEGKRG